MFHRYCALGFTQIGVKEDGTLRETDVNALTRTAFYSCELMSRQAWRIEHEFEKECLNQMARSTLREHVRTFDGSQDLKQKYTTRPRNRPPSLPLEPSLSPLPARTGTRSRSRSAKA